LNHSTLAELSKMVEDYPFHQAARLLYVANLFAVRDKSFGDELRKASVLVPDRVALFQMFEGIHYEVERQKESETVENSIVTEGDDRTVNLIDNFLQSQIPPTEASENGNTLPHDVPTIAEVTSDYATFLEMQDIQALETETPTLQGAELIDNFIKETSGRQRYEMPEINDEDELGILNNDYNETVDDDLYNEKIVSILIKQGRYEQALEILNKICLNNPEKNTTFATQMRLLEVVVGHNAQDKH
jgi:hypothetical protein